MLQDDLENFEQNLYNYLVGEEEIINRNLVKKHSGNLHTQGDFSFVNIVKPWKVFLDELKNLDETLLKCVDKDIADLLNTSQDWSIPIVKAEEVKDRVHLFIDRQKAIHVGLEHATRNIAGLLQSMSKDTPMVIIDSSCSNSNSVQYLRVKCLKEVIKNLYCIHTSPEKQNLTILVTWRSEHTYQTDNFQSVLCGPVINAATGLKENTITGSEFIKLKQDELTLIAQHKYGMRVSTMEKWQEFIAQLGESAVKFELMQTKYSSPVKIPFNALGQSSKGAAFILYNCARLETIIRTFNERVAEGIYPELPSLEYTNLSLLTDEDEWGLIFTYIMGLPSLLRSCAVRGDSAQQDRDYVFRPHLVCNFLNSMVRLLSQYYRRVRILTEPRNHLLPVLFARMHMLIILNKTLKTCLTILNIKSISQMYYSYFLF